MRVGHSLAGFVCAAGIGIGALAAPPVRAATIMGVGITISCGGWVETRKTPSKTSFEEWALGYLSGVAMWSPISPLDGLDPSAVYVWLDNFCQQRPLERFKTALDEFVRQRAAAAPPATSAQPTPAQPARPPAAPAPRR